jgi:hypothetical protein
MIEYDQMFTKDIETNVVKVSSLSPSWGQA